MLICTVVMHIPLAAQPYTGPLTEPEAAFRLRRSTEPHSPTLHRRPPSIHPQTFQLLARACEKGLAFILQDVHAGAT